MEKQKSKVERYLSYVAAAWLLVFVLGLPVLTVFRMSVKHIPFAEYEDNIFGGYKMIELNTRISELLSGGNYMESNEVLLGKDGWLFYKATEDGTPLYDYMGINRFSEDELIAAYGKLEAVMREAEAAGARSVVLTIPNKEQIYDKYMPDTVERISDESRLDQLTSYIYEKNGSMNVSNSPYIDMTEIYECYRDAYQLYFKTDTHYTGIGEYLALKEVMRAIYDGETEDCAGNGTTAAADSGNMTGSQGAATDIDSQTKTAANAKGQSSSDDDTVITAQTDADGNPILDGIVFVRRPGFEGDLARISATSDRFDEVSYEMAYDSVPEDEMRDETLLIIGDSFGDGLQHPAEHYYKEVRYLNIKEYEPGCIEAYEPDVVVFECVERYLPRLIGAEY